MWAWRESYLTHAPRFQLFRLLRGLEREVHTLYSSHVVWDDHASFEARTRSEAFRAAHRNAGESRAKFLGH